MKNYIKSVVIAILMISLSLAASAAPLKHFLGTDNSTGARVEFFEQYDGTFKNASGEVVTKEQINTAMSKSTSSLGRIEGFVDYGSVVFSYKITELEDGNWEVVRTSSNGSVNTRIGSSKYANQIAGAIRVTSRILKFSMLKLDPVIIRKVYPKFESQSTKLEELTKAPESRINSFTQKEKITHTLQAGEDLYRVVTREFGISMEQFWKVNPQLSGEAGVGAVLTKYGQTYTVKDGDTLWGIAVNEFGVNLTQMYKDNPVLSKKKWIYTGEVIYRYGVLESTPIERVDGEGEIITAEYQRAEHVATMSKEDKNATFNAITFSGVTEHIATQGSNTYTFYKSVDRSLNEDMYSYRGMKAKIENGVLTWYRTYEGMNDTARKIFTDIGNVHLSGNTGQGVKILMQDSFNLDKPNQRHGDWTSEIVLTVAPGVELMRPKLEFDLADRQEYIMKADIVNMSNSFTSDLAWTTENRSKELQVYIDSSKTAFAPHTLVVTSAGNGFKTPNSIHKFDFDYSCSQIDTCDYRSYGYLQDGSAMQDRWIVVGELDSGVLLGTSGDIQSSSTRAGILKDHYIVAPSLNARGTSFSTPVVTGVAALMWNNLDLPEGQKAAAIKLKLLSTAKDMGATGVDEIWGHGLVDVAAALAPSIN